MMTKGFTASDLVERTPLSLIAQLGCELALSNQAIFAISEELKQLKFSKKQHFSKPGNTNEGENKKPRKSGKEQ